MWDKREKREKKYVFKFLPTSFGNNYVDPLPPPLNTIYSVQLHMLNHRARSHTTHFHFLTPAIDGQSACCKNCNYLCGFSFFFLIFLSTAKRNQDWKKWMDKSRILDLCVIIMVTMLLHWLYLMLNICLLHFRSCIKSKTFDNYVTNEE